MSVAGRLAVLALRPLAEGACSATGQAPGDAAVAPAQEFLARKLAENAAFADALRKAMERAWKTMEIALNGAAWLRQTAARPDDRALAEKLRGLVQHAEPAVARREGQRRLALSELKEARKKNYLNMPSAPVDGMAAGLSRGAALYARFDDFDVLLKADRSAVQQIAEELNDAGYTNLAAVLLPEEGPPLLAMAIRYFFQRAIGENSQLTDAFSFSRFEELLPELQQAFDELYEVLTHLNRRLEEALGNAAAAAPEARVGSLDLKAEEGGAGAAHADLYRDVSELLRRFDLTHPAVRPHEAHLVRNEHERQQMRRVVERCHELPVAQRRKLPALVNAAAKLELAAGDVAAAVHDFQLAADAIGDPAGKGEAHMNAHRAALEQPDYVVAVKEFLEAVKVDGKRFASFPVGKYIPVRVLGAGGFGTAFLCKHKYMNAQVVVKTLSTEGLERDVDDVFSEAQALGAINHHAIIRVQDCGYVDASRKHRPFLVMDYFDAPTLREYVRQHGPLSVPELLALVEPVAAGLEAAHAKGIMHRDIKPDNLLVRRMPDVQGKPRFDVKLIDFGLSLKQQQVRSGDQSSKLAAAAGTTEYAAPEQLGRLPGVETGPQSDIYSFGKTCCFALFETTAPLLKHWKSIPQPLADLLERCLSDLPQERPKDFTVILRCFNRLEQGGADIPVVNTIPDGRGEPVTVARRADGEADDRDYSEPPPRGGGRTVLAILGVLALLLLLGCTGGAGALYYFWDDITGTRTDSQLAGSAPETTRSTIPPFKINDGNAGGGGGTDEKKKTRTIAFTGVPSKEVADFIIDRVRADDDHAPRVSTTTRTGGNDVTVVVEDKFGSNVEDWLRKLDLGPVERDGERYQISVTGPPEPSRKPAEKLDLPPLSAGDFQAVVVAFRTNRNVREAITLLKLHSPKEEQRGAIRNLLKSKLGDPFEGKDAAEALGNWGTAEDIPLLTAQDARNPFAAEAIIKALGQMREAAGAPYLVKKLNDPFQGEKAADALRNIGPAAEKDVQSVLSGNDRTARKRACALLKDIGSTASIAALKSAARDPDREVSTTAWEALKTLAFYPAKPFTADPGPAVVDKPKTTSTVDDLKVTTLEDAAAGIAANIALATDGQGFYTLEPAGNLRRWDWDGKIAASAPARGMNLMTVARSWVMLANSSDARQLDPARLETKTSGQIDNMHWLSAGAEADVAIARCDGAIATLFVIDVNTFLPVGLYTEKRVPGLKTGTYTIMASLPGLTDPVLTPDGRTLFMQTEGKLQRLTVNVNKVTAQDASKPLGAGTGKVVVSPDGKSVALLFRDGNKETPGQTAIFATSDLKKPLFTIDHGPRVTALAFDGKGNIFAATEAKSLIRFDAEGKKLKEYDLGGVTRQLVVSSDGARVLVLTRDKLLRVDLP